MSLPGSHQQEPCHQQESYHPATKNDLQLGKQFILNRFRAEIGLCSSYIFCYGSLIWEINKVPIKSSI